ncbi:MAG TPA: SprT family zinc-dependent metalloprotease [Methylophilaceae bacterium]|nr:SprT family zinc-dependent metalloprotease [Methylophilaceae bacterium]
MNEHFLALPDGEQIPYKLERRKRRTVGMRISPHGLVVHAPVRISLQQLNALLLSKAHWILTKLRAQQEHAVEAFEWRDGGHLLWLGNEMVLNLRHDTKSRAIIQEPGQLHVALPQPDDVPSVSRKVLLWYRKQAQADFSRRLQILAARLGVDTPPLYLSNARSRWGSCNSRGEIRLNWRLIQAPPHIINYVICHELAHLKEMNHSARFWAVVAQLHPDYKRAEQELKALSARLHQLDMHS